MERHKCKLCFRSFSNGRALGGHMRSHMINLQIVPPKPQEELHVVDSASISPSSSSSSSSEDEEKGGSYELRENPKKSNRLVDPEFSSFGANFDSGSVVLQDRESETESSKNPTRRRSKRDFNRYRLHQEQAIVKKTKFHNNIIVNEHHNSLTENEPVSSISDATTEEDVAFCLMMLSRDKWTNKQGYAKNDEEEDEEEEPDEDEAEKSLSSDSEEMIKFSMNRKSKYKCETCKKVFRSYQALGGHRASHKKIKVSTPIYEPEFEQENAGSCLADRKIHECPVCYRVFSSGQALGGHKRSHVTGFTSTVKNPAKTSATNLIDLNLPAPIDDDDLSQIELSAVSDAEFMKPIRL